VEAIEGEESTKKRKQSTPTLIKILPSSKEREYTFWARSSCCFSHMASPSPSSLKNPARSWNTCTNQKCSTIKPFAGHLSACAYRRAHQRHTTNLPHRWCRCLRRRPRTVRSGSTAPRAEVCSLDLVPTMHRSPDDGGIVALQAEGDRSVPPCEARAEVSHTAVAVAERARTCRRR
jgi:hypothetical protein